MILSNQLSHTTLTEGELQHLDTDDQLLTPDGATVTVDWLDWDAGVTAPAWDLTVAEEHNFFVTADGTAETVLVHNQDEAAFFCGVSVDFSLVRELVDVDRLLTDVERLRFAVAADLLDDAERAKLLDVIADQTTALEGAGIARSAGLNAFATQEAVRGELAGNVGFVEGLLGGLNYDRFAVVADSFAERADAADIVRRLADDVGAEAGGDRAFRIARSFTDNERARQALIRYANDTDGVLVNPATPEEYWGSANAVLEMIDDLTLTEPPLGAELVEKFVGQIGQINRGELDELVQALDEDPIEFLNRLERVGPAGTPLWLIVLEQGRRFNADNNVRYLNQGGAVELYLGRGPDGGPPYYILDSYVPPNPAIDEVGQIVSRKNTQLASVQESTAIGYITELTRKYPPGSRIASTDSVPTDLKGQTLEGQMYLEIPVQDAPIPQAILDFASNQVPNSVKIRDVTGRVYN